MENFDFSGKTIVPFCTSGGSGIGESAENLHSLCSDNAIWLNGDRLSGGLSRSDMIEWIDGLGLNITAN
ncbi:flavodoxin [Blautia sp. JLR.GB0024]|uniref:flavodoxin n=1 Tax=Blautia sp. JLR.GB0024 TaxID=3123295 RepID=UPI0030067BAE